MNEKEDSFHSSMERIELVQKIVREYLRYASTLGSFVPHLYEKIVVEELSIRVQEMITKRVYGYVNLNDYRASFSENQKREAERRYLELVALAPKKVGN